MNPREWLNVLLHSNKFKFAKYADLRIQGTFVYTFLIYFVGGLSARIHTHTQKYTY